MSNPWFRLYSEIIDDEKIRLLAFEDRWHYVAILCLKNAGFFDKERSDDLLRRGMSVKLGVNGVDLENLKTRLMEVDLIDDDWQPLGWDSRQFKSDSSKERVRRWREKKKNPAEYDVTPRNVTVTAQESDTDTEEETDKRLPSKVPPDDFKPREIDLRQIKAKRPDLHIPTVVDLFKATEYQYPRSDWDRAFFKFALTQREQQGVSRGTARVSFEESKHPAIVAERERRGLTKIGDM